MQDLIRQLKYIQSAAREGSISGAAEAESISPSSILLAIDKFESRFQTQLFVRLKSKGLRLTEDGQSVIDRINSFIDEVHGFEDDLARDQTSVEGELNIGMFSAVSSHIAPMILSSLSANYPSLGFQLREGNQLQVQHDLRNGLVDVALMYDKFLEDDVTATRILEVRPHAVLAETDPLALNDRVSVMDLATKPLILLNTPDGMQYVMGVFSQFGVQPKVLYRTASYEMIRSSAAFGLGVGILVLKPLIDMTYSGRRVAHRPLAEDVEPVSLAVVTRRDERPSRRTQIFIEHCQDFCRSDLARGFSVQ